MGGTAGSGSRLPEQSLCRIWQFAWTDNYVWKSIQIILFCLQPKLGQVNELQKLQISIFFFFFWCL